MNRKIALLAFTAVSLALQAMPLAAQDRTEEIIVTARKRQESLLNVPVVETAIPQQQIEQYQTHDLYTLATRVPGLVMGDQIGAISTGVSLRGIGTTAENATVDQSVSLNIDGLQLSQALAYKAALFDLGQVEVLKGPQALFYGKNSPGGVISLRSADPTDKFEVILRTGYETVAREKYGEAIVSGPVSDSLKARLGVHYSKNDGYFRNLETAPAGFGVFTPTTKKYADDENVVVRGTALFNPSEKYDARLKATYTHDFTNHVGLQLADCPYGKTGFVPGVPIFDPAEDCKLNRNVYIADMSPSAFPGIRNGGVPYYRSHQEFGSLEQNLHLGDFTLTSVTGLYSVHQESVDNGSGTSGVVTLATNNDFFIRQFTEEARVASNFTSSPVNFMVGGFYQDERMTNHVRLLLNTQIPGIPLPGLLQDAIHGIDVSSYSGFGQVIWKITDQLELAGGARVTHETRNHQQYNVATPGVPVGATPLLDPHLSSTNTSPEVSLTYKPITDITLFASYKQGYKSGSFNTVTYIDPSTGASFGDEAVKGGEVGLKSRLLDRRLSLNVAGYYYHYTGLQVGSNEITPSGVIAIRTLNAASAKVKGIDFDASYSPEQVDGLTLRAAVNYNHARYASFPNAPCYNGQLISEGCNQLFSTTDGFFHAQNLTHRPLVRAPDWVFTPGIDYETPVGQNMTLTLGGSLIYSSKYYTNLIDSNETGFLQNHYAKVNLNIGLKGPHEAWEVALIANNVTDKITAGQCYNAPQLGAVIFGGTITGSTTRGPAGGDYPNCEAERGREVWLRLTVRPLEFMHD